MRPMVTGSDRNNLGRVRGLRPKRADLFRRKAENMAKTGVDLIMMELMRDCDYRAMGNGGCHCNRTACLGGRIGGAPR